VLVRRQKWYFSKQARSEGARFIYPRYELYYELRRGKRLQPPARRLCTNRQVTARSNRWSSRFSIGALPVMVREGGVRVRPATVRYGLCSARHGIMLPRCSRPAEVSYRAIA